MDGWMGGWVDVQNTLALESYKHNNNFVVLIEKHFFFLVLNFQNFYIYYFFLMFFRGPWHFFIICRLEPLFKKKKTLKSLKKERLKTFSYIFIYYL